MPTTTQPRPRGRRQFEFIDPMADAAPSQQQQPSRSVIRSAPSRAAPTPTSHAPFSGVNLFLPVAARRDTAAAGTGWSSLTSSGAAPAHMPLRTPRALERNPATTTTTSAMASAPALTATTTTGLSIDLAGASLAGGRGEPSTPTDRCRRSSSMPVGSRRLSRPAGNATPTALTPRGGNPTPAAAARSAAAAASSSGGGGFTSASLATTPRGSYSRTHRHSSDAAAAAAAAAATGPAHEAAAAVIFATYSERKARSIDCGYFDAVPTRGFDGVFRAAAGVIVRTFAASTPHTPAPPTEDAHGNSVGPSGGHDDGDGDGDGDGDYNSSNSDADDGRASTGAASSTRPRGRRGLPSTTHLRHPGSLGFMLTGAAAGGLSPSPTPSVVSSAGFRRVRSTGRASTVMTGGTATTTIRRGPPFRFGQQQPQQQLPDLTSSRAVRYSQSRLNRRLDMAATHSGGLHASLWLAAQDGSIEVRSLAKPQTILSVVPSKKAARSVVMALLQVSGNAVAAGLSDGSVRLYDAATVALVKDERAHSAAVTCMTLLPAAPLPSAADPRAERAAVLVTGSMDWTIGLWAAATLAPLGRLQGNRNGVSALCAAGGGGGGGGNGRFVFSGGEDGVLRLWSVLDCTAVELSREERLCLQIAAASAAGGRSASPTATATGATTPRTMLRRTSQGPPAVSLAPDGSSSSGSSDNDDGDDGDGSSIGEYILVGPGTDISPLRADSHDHHRRDKSKAKKKKGAKVKPKKTNKITATAGGGGAAAAAPAGEVRLSKEAFAAFKKAEAYLRDYRTGGPLSGRSEVYSLLLDTTEFPPQDTTAYTNPIHFNWPVNLAHREAVTGLTVVENRWLVSVSRDTTAKVYGLPNGAFVRSLAMQRKTPLTGVHYDAVALRLLVGCSDGTVMAFDVRTPGMNLVMQVRPPSASFASTYVPIQTRSMHRFFLPSQDWPLAPVTAAAGDDAAVVVAVVAGGGKDANYDHDEEDVMGVIAVATFDKTTLSHGPGRTFTTYRVGEPSLRELNGAMQLSKLHAQVARDRETQAGERATCGSVAERAALESRQSARVLRLSHARALLGRYLARWGRCVARARLAPGRELAAAALAPVTCAPVARRYFALWRRFCELISAQTHQDAMGRLAARGAPCADAAATTALLGVNLTEPLARNAAVRDGMLRAQRRLAAARSDACESLLTLRYYSAWVAATAARRVEDRREVALNRLLLSFGGAQFFSAASFIWRVAGQHALRCLRLRRASALLAERHATVAVPRLRWRYFGMWTEAVRAARSERARADEQDGWQLVAPLSATLVRPQLLRARCFHLWRDFALYAAKNTRLTEESRTMHREYLSLQNTIDNPATVAQLRQDEAELQTAIARAAFGRDAMGAREKVLRQEVISLRMHDALRVLLSGFTSQEGYNQRREASLEGVDASSATPSGRNSPVSGGSGGAWRSQSHRNGRQSVASSSSAAPDDNDPSPSSQSSSMVSLEEQLQAVMNAVKGTAMQYARDEKQVAAAYNFALHLAVLDPHTTQQQQAAAATMAGHPYASFGGALGSSYGFLASGGAGGSGGGGAMGVHRRQLSQSGNFPGSASANWSVTVTSTGSAGGPRRPSAVALAGGSSPMPVYQRGGGAVRSFSGGGAGAPRANGGTGGVVVGGGAGGGIGGGGPPGTATARQYACLSDAFDATAQQLHAVLCAAAREAGVDLEGSNGLLVLPSDDMTADDLAEGGGLHNRGAGAACTPPTPPADDDHANQDDDDVEARVSTSVPQPQPRHPGPPPPPPSQQQQVSSPTGGKSPAYPNANAASLRRLPDALQRSLRWLRFVPARTRKEVMGLALQLVVLHDSFVAHSEMSLESGSSTLSTRGATTVRALPLASLCGEATAALLVRHAAVVLELLQPHLWALQRHMTALAEGCLGGENAVAVTIVDPTAPPPQQQQQGVGAATAAGCVSGLSRSQQPHHQVHGQRRQSQTLAQQRGTMPRTAAGGSGGGGGGGARPPVHSRGPSGFWQSHSTIGDPLDTGGAGDYSGGSNDNSMDEGNPVGAGATPLRGDHSRHGHQPSYDEPPPRMLSQGGGGGGGGGNGPTHPLSRGPSAPYVPPISPFTGHSNRNNTAGGFFESAGDGDVMNLSRSMPSYSGASTPRAMTPRALTPRSGAAAMAAAGLSAAAAGAVIHKPFLGFRVNAQRDTTTAAGGGSSSSSTGRVIITIKEVIPLYVNAGGQEEDGPALAAGMAVGDQLLRFAGYAVTDLPAFNAVVSRHVKPGVDLPVTLLRDGAQVQATIHVGLKSNMM